MKTRLFVSIVFGLAALTSGAWAQDSARFAPTGISTEDIVGPLPPLAGRIACYKLVDEPNYCVLPEVPRIINHTIPFNVIDINGGWIGPSGERPYIYVYNTPSASGGYTIAVDLSLMNRPDGFGFFLNGSNMSIVFPDDSDYKGTISPDGRTIYWSNNTVWTKQ